MTDITDSTPFEAQSPAMTKINPTDAKFWPRAYATLVDGVILTVITFVIVILIGYLFDYYRYTFYNFISPSDLNDETSARLNIVFSTAIAGFMTSFILRLIYCCYYLSSDDQATPGMKFHSLKLVNAQGNRVSFGQVFLRELVSIISFWGFFMGYLMILFTHRRQALHDMVTSTYVQDMSDHPNVETLISQHDQNYMYGGFWRRLGASLVDNIICIGFSLSCLIILVFKNPYNYSDTLLTNLYLITNDDNYSIIFNLLFNIFPMFYWIFFTASKFQATPGKMLFSLKVMDIHGNRLTLFRSFIRYFSYFISTITFGIGFIMVAFTKRKQGLHDKIALTYVIRVSKKAKDDSV